MNKLVLFRGERYWLTEGGALAFLDQCDDQGDVTAFFEESFAHVSPEGVFRYGCKIGEADEVVPMSKVVDV